jgi:hypothetical protein
MPFHAAGLHSQISTENVYCRAISSYTPSIKALAYARGRRQDKVTTPGGLLITIMKTTLGERSLPGITEEKDAILKAISSQLVSNKLDRPCVECVAESLRRCSIAHFACHGRTRHDDPSDSGLIFPKIQ